MLLIRRKPGESILIGENVELQVVEVVSGRVTLGIAAPREVLILRKEIQVAQSQNIAAAQGVTPESIQLLISSLRTR